MERDAGDKVANRKGNGTRDSFVINLLKWFRQEARDLPWRRTRDPYGIWISEVMLQQTQVKTVIPYWERWMQALPTIASLAGCKPERVLKLWEGLGYYHRARNLQKAAQCIVAQHGGVFPRRFEDVLSLPGIGRYTAGAIGSIAFNAATAILDGNAIRVLTRYFAVRGDPKNGKVNEQLWTLAGALVQRASEFRPVKGSGNCSTFNQALMELGATVCTASNPACHRCPVGGGCYARKNACAAMLPELPERRKTEKCHFVAIVLQRGDKVLLRQRPSGVVNAQLWEFPNVELSSHDEPSRIAKRMAGNGVEHLATIRHTITRYRMTLEAFYSATAKAPKAGPGEWLSLRQAVGLAYPSAHRQVLQRALQRLNHPIRDDEPAPGGRGENSRRDRSLRASVDRR
jgi:A/G-specific adenine glycosylase